VLQLAHGFGSVLNLKVNNKANMKNSDREGMSKYK
jgi:hypothetical protein